jgi:hypothetical protein
MSTLERELVKGYVQKLSQVQALLVAETPSAQVLAQVEMLVDDVLADMRRYLKSPIWPEPTTDAPDLATLEDWLTDGACEATDGCFVEPDGTCPHGHPSWLIVLGLI